MNRTADRAHAGVRPYLILGIADGGYSLALRETRFNSQNYPIVTTTILEETFVTATAARAFAKKNFGAVAGDFELRPAPARP